MLAAAVFLASPEWRQQQPAGDTALARALESVPSSSDAWTALGDERLVVLHLPREKERLAMSLHALAGRMSPAGRLWLVGANREGVRSAGHYLERLVGPSEHLQRVGELEAMLG